MKLGIQGTFWNICILTSDLYWHTKSRPLRKEFSLISKLDRAHSTTASQQTVKLTTYFILRFPPAGTTTTTTPENREYKTGIGQKQRNRRDLPQNHDQNVTVNDSNRASRARSCTRHLSRASLSFPFLAAATQATAAQPCQQFV